MQTVNAFWDGEINTADQGAVLTRGSQQVPSRIHDRNIVGDADLIGFGFNCCKHTLRFLQRTEFRMFSPWCLPLLIGRLFEVLPYVNNAVSFFPGDHAQVSLDADAAGSSF
jgi:hypothetical protein